MAKWLPIFVNIELLIFFFIGKESVYSNQYKEQEKVGQGDQHSKINSEFGSSSSHKGNTTESP